MERATSRGCLHLALTYFLAAVCAAVAALERGSGRASLSRACVPIPKDHFPLLQAIPHALAGRDVLGAAKTGSGKTLAFLVPVRRRRPYTPAAHSSRTPRRQGAVRTRRNRTPSGCCTGQRLFQTCQAIWPLLLPRWNELCSPPQAYKWAGWLSPMPEPQPAGSQMMERLYRARWAPSDGIGGAQTPPPVTPEPCCNLQRPQLAQTTRAELLMQEQRLSCGRCGGRADIAVSRFDYECDVAPKQAL